VNKSKAARTLLALLMCVALLLPFGTLASAADGETVILFV
jgi:hypothetical protein